MGQYDNDRLMGAETLQTSFSGIYGSITLPTNIVTRDQYNNPNSDYVDFYLIHNEFAEGGISWEPVNGYRLFLNTYGGDGGNQNWQSHAISEPIISSKGIWFGHGSTVTLRLESYGDSTSLFCNGVEVYAKQPNRITQNKQARVAYTHGCKDEFGYVQHNTATWSNVNLQQNGTWVPWDWAMGYAPYTKNADRYGVYTSNPLSAYLAKPTGKDIAGDGNPNT